MTKWTLRQAVADDANWIADLRAVVMKPGLEALGRYHPVWIRERFLNKFEPAHTWIIRAVGAAGEGAPDKTATGELDADIGVIAVRSEPEEKWIEHFYLAPSHQGRGIGAQVLAHLVAEHADERPFRLNVLQGSPARSLYERHGFVFEHEDPVDVFMVARPPQPANSNP